MTNTFPSIGKITYGKDHNYFQEFTVSNSDFGNQSIDGYQPTGMIWFSTTHVIFSVKGITAKVVEGSFNGNTLHFYLDAADASYKTINMPNRVVSKFWLRVVGGGSAVVSVQAW